VAEVHDLHIWTISSGIYALSVHVVVRDHNDRDCLTWEFAGAWGGVIPSIWCNSVSSKGRSAF
jgi:hypothetical protein